MPTLPSCAGLCVPLAVRVLAWKRYDYAVARFNKTVEMLDARRVLGRLRRPVCACVRASVLMRVCECVRACARVLVRVRE